MLEYIEQVDFLFAVAACKNAIEASAALQNNVVDLVFLDIQMPHILGTSFLRTLKHPPKVIFTTAYREFAVEGFELNAVDYLLKPVSFERFLQAVNKVLHLNLEPALPVPVMNEKILQQSSPFMYFRVDRKMVKVFLDDIIYIESRKDYVKIITGTKVILTKQPISSLEELLPAESFIRIHRSYIVAIKKIDSVKADAVEVSKMELPIGRLFKMEVNRTLNIEK